MPEKIIINWECQNSKHEILLINQTNGKCLTHNCLVSEYTRCKEFPCQSAMWTDLWNMEIKKGAQNDSNTKRIN